MRRIYFLFMMVPLMVSILPGLSPFEVSAQTKPIEWRINHVSIPGTTYQELTAVELPKRIQKITEGRLKVIILADLIKPADLLTALALRKIDGMICPMVYFERDFPQIGIAQVPFMVEDLREFFQLKDKLGVTSAINDMLLKRSNSLLLGIGTYTEQVFWSKKPLQKVEDFRDAKLRLPAYLQAKVLEQLGGKPVTMPFGEFYLALQTGVVDGGYTGVASGFGIQLPEVAQYMTRWPFGNMSPWNICVTKGTWDALPKDLQLKAKDVVDSISKDAAGAVIKEQADVIAKLRAKGMKVSMDQEAEQKAKLKQLAGPAISEWRKRVKEAGYEISPILKDHMTARGIWAP